MQPFAGLTKPGFTGLMGARSILADLSDKQYRFSRWARSLVERRGYWKAAITIAAKNLRLPWAVLHYGEGFRLETGRPA